MSKALPWYKRTPADWQRGTRKHAMSFELRGFYSECLDAMWELQDQLPKDAKRLAMMLGSNPRQVRALMAKLVALGKMVETVAGYYNPRMMADILGVDSVPNEGPFAAQSTSNGCPIEVEPTPKIPKKPAKTTRDLESESEIDSITPLPPDGGKGDGQDFWSKQFKGQDDDNGIVFSGGRVRLANGTLAFWLERFGDRERLDLALVEAAGLYRPNAPHTLRTQVERTLARIAGEKRDRDARYAAAAAKPKGFQPVDGPGPMMAALKRRMAEASNG